jgi:hypothetical protein
VKNDWKFENPWTKKHYQQSLFHQVHFVFVKEFLLFFAMVQASICYLPSMEEGEEQYDGSEVRYLLLIIVAREFSSILLL